MRRRILHSKTFALIFSLLIVLSSLTVMSPMFQIVGAKPTRGEENVWYVDDDAPDGGDGSLEKPYQKIQNAINNTTDGDTVRVFNGTYFDNVVVDKRISLIGNGSEETIITGDGSGKGVLLDGISGATIEFLQVEDFEYGVYLLNSDDNILSNIDALYNKYGIYISQSMRNTLSNNEASDNDFGIFIDGLFESSDYNTLNGNTISNNHNGIFLLSSFQSTLAMNHLVENGISITGFSLEAYNTHTIDTTNSVNGKPVRYYKNSDGITVPSGAGQIIIANCTNMVVKDQKLSNGNVGILVAYSSTITIQNNTCSKNNDHGIDLHKSNQNILTNNTCSNNTGDSDEADGIYLHQSNDNILMNNTCTNNAYGIHLGLSDGNILTNNIISHNIWFAICVQNSDRNTFAGNSVSNNDGYGIRLSGSDYNTLTNNICSNNDNYAIFLDESNHNTISRSTISDNLEGIYLQYSSLDNTMHFNNIFNTNDCGINASNNDGFSVDAAHNWWGDASGPYHPVNNSAGKGDHVTDYVEFDPWVSEKLFRTLFVANYGNDSAGNGSKENPFLTIQKAVDESNDLDTIRIFEGVYEENVVVDKSVEIFGNGSEETIIDGLGGGNTDDEDGLNCRYIGGFGGAYQDVAYDGKYLYAVHSRGLSIFNVSDPSNPKEISFIQTAVPAFRVTVSGNYAYVADSVNGLVIINISDPGSPEEEGLYNTAGYAWGVAVSGDYAYVADDSNGLVIVDISDPSNPNEEGHYDTVGHAWGVAVSGDYAYVADRFNGLVIINISEKENPTLAGGYDTADEALGVAVSGDYAYLADDSNGLVIVNISDPNNPNDEGHYDTNGTSFGVSVSSDYAYVADRNNGFVIVDISEKENPTLAGGYDTAGETWGVAVSDDFVYVADYLNGLIIINISDPGNPVGEGHYYTAALARGVTISGEYAYIADQSSGLVIVNISDTSNLVLEGHYPGNSRGVAVSGDYAYLADNLNGLVILNMSDPRNPMEVGHYDTAGYAYDVAVRGNYAYVADYHNGLVIVDISDKKNPKEEGHYDTAGYAWSVAVSGGFAYIADSENGLVIVDISDPSNPANGGRFNTEDDARGIAVDGSIAYVADRRNGLVIVDIIDPENPQEVGHYDTASTENVVVSGDYAYVADSDNGLVIINISDPGNPEGEGHYDTAASAYGVAVSGDFVYVANRDHGLVIVEMLFPTTAIQITSRSKLSSLTITHGSRTGVLIDSDNVEIDHCKITGNNDGIKVINESENIDIHDSDIFENNRMGINARGNGGKTITALNNWWGHPSGPYHPTKNPEGTGNEVSDHVNFDPWLSRPINFRIHYVAPDGNDTTGNGEEENPYKTIQKAIGMAQDWDTIIVAPGTYSQSITINKRNVTLIADSPSTTNIDAGGATTAGEITADDVELNGFTIRNSTENGILITNSSGVKIINCVFPDNSYDLNLSYSTNIQLTNTTFETVNFNDASSDISVFWPVDLKVTDNRTGFLPNAHLKITDTFGTTIFDDYTDDEGRIPQMLLLEYYQNLSSRIEFNPCTISVWKDGYLYSSEEYSITSYTRLTYELQTHILPVAIISGEIIQEVDMDSMIFFDGTESTGRSITHFWEFGDDSSSASPTPSHTYTIPRAYQVNLTVSDDYNNASITSIIVIVENVDPTAQAETSTNSAFENEEIQFDASNSWDTPSDIISFLWDFGDGTQTAYVSPTHVYQDEGEYTVTLTVIDMFGGESTTNLYITITNIEPWIIETNVTGMHYSGKPLHFTVTADDTAGDVPSLQYTWDFGDGTMGPGQNVTRTYSEPGVYAVNLTVTDNNGALAHTLIYAMITDPFIMVNISSTSILQDETVFFNVSHEQDDGSFVYSWYFGDGNSVEEKEASHIFTKSGTFTLWLKINDGTKNTTIILQQIIVSNVVPVPIIICDIPSVSEDESLHFDASSTSDSPTDRPNLIYTWDFEDGTTGVGIEVTHAFSERGNYTVILTVNDGKATRTTEVEVEVQNLPPVADAGTPKVRKATMEKAIILDASGTTDTPSDIADLNFTWKIGSDIVYGEVVSYTFVATGEFTVTLTVRDNDGATSEDTLTFEVSKSSESEDEETMSALNWILVLIMIVLLMVIGFLISKVRDEELYKEMIAEREAEETIVMEGEIDEESFKPQDDDQVSTGEVAEEQDGEMTDAEADVEGGETNDDIFTPPGNDQKNTDNVAEDQQVEIPDEEGGVVEEGEN